MQVSYETGFILSYFQLCLTNSFVLSLFWSIVKRISFEIYFNVDLSALLKLHNGPTTVPSLCYYLMLYMPLYINSLFRAYFCSTTAVFVVESAIIMSVFLLITVKPNIHAHILQVVSPTYTVESLFYVAVCTSCWCGVHTDRCIEFKLILCVNVFCFGLFGAGIWRME